MEKKSKAQRKTLAEQLSAIKVSKHIKDSPEPLVESESMRRCREILERVGLPKV
jgi:hypothetical protein